MPAEETDRPGAGEVRCSDADRDRLAAVLGRHYMEGRLSTDDLSQRLEAVYGAHHTEEAAGVLADLPPLQAPSQTRRRGRRHGEASHPQAAWLPTTERFRDPSTRRLMRVWVDPADGSRHYIAEDVG